MSDSPFTVADIPLVPPASPVAPLTPAYQPLTNDLMTLAQSRDSLNPEVKKMNLAPRDRPENQGAVDLMNWNLFQTAKAEAGTVAPEKTANAKRILKQYRDYRASRGEEPFQFLDKGIQREQAKVWRENLPVLNTLFAGTDKMEMALPEGERALFLESFKHSLDPDRDKKRAANMKLVSEMTGKPLEEINPAWDSIRSNFAGKALGLSGVVDENQFYAAAGKLISGEKADSDLMEKIGNRAATLALQGKPLAESMAAVKGLAGDRWQEFAPAARQGHASILADFSDKEITLADALWNRFQRDQMETGKSQSAEAPDAGAAMAEYGKLPQADREKILGAVALRAQDEGEDVTNYFARVGQSFKSGIYGMATGLTAAYQAGNEAAIDQILKSGKVSAFTPKGQVDAKSGPTGESAETRDITPEERASLESQAAMLKGSRAFLTDLPNAGIKSKRYLDQSRDGFWDSLGDYSVMAAESLPMMATAAVPYGGGLLLNAAGYAEQNMATLRADNPDVDASKLEGAAYSSAVLQAGIDRVQIGIMGARLPKVTGWAYRQAKILRAPLAFGIKAGVTGAAETGQEVLQDLTPGAITELADALGGDIQGPDWSKVLAKEKESLGDIVGVSLLFGMIGGAGHVIAAHMDAPKIREVLTDREGLRLAGHTPEVVEAVATEAETNPLAAAETLKAAMIETPVEVRRANAQAAKAELEANPPPTAQEAFVPDIQQREDGSIAVVYPDGSEDHASTMEDAIQAVRVWEAEDANIQEQGIREYIRHLEGYHEGNPELAAKGTYTGKEVSFESWAGQSKERLDQAHNRVKIAMRQSGIELSPDEQIDLSQYLILGSSRNSYGAGVTRIAMEVNKAQGKVDRAGSTVLTPIEEHSEGIAKWLMDTGKKSESWVIQNIRDTEANTKQGKTLPDNLMQMSEPARRQEIAEAFSRLAVANALGRVQESQLSAGLKAIFRAIKESIHAILSLASDIKGFRESGKMDAEFSYWLDVAAGINEDYYGENMARQMEADMMAEAMDGMPEIKKALAGKLPHPETLEAKGNPLAGEVRALHDEIKNSQESGANQAARTRKANDFFLPVGTMEDLDHVRDVVNEQGFEFATPSEMIDSAMLSIGYGKPQYGTASNMDEDWEPTFSVAPINQFIEGSKVVNDDGSPKIVYHGSPDVRGIIKDGFKKSPTRGDVFFFSEDYATANSYADDRRAFDYQNAEPHTLPVYLSLKNPLEVDAKGQKWRNTEAHIQQAKKGGHDGIIIRNSRDEYNNTGTGGKPVTVYAVFDPKQIKSASTGSIRSRIDGIDLGNPTFSIARVTPAQDAEYLALAKDPEKNAEKLRSMVESAAKANGYNQRAYHGTWRAGFTVFNELTHFSPDKTYADRYQSTSASSMGISGVKEALNQSTYEVFLKMQKPFDTRQPKSRKLFNDEFLGKWGNGTPIQERGLPDWTDSVDLAEWLDEEHPGQFDSFILDEGAEPTEAGAIAVRPESFVPLDPRNIKSADPVTRDASGKVIPLSQRFDASKDSISFAIAKADSPLLTAIDALILSPEKKAEIYKRMKRKVADVRKRFEQRRLRGEFDDGDNLDLNRFEQIRDIATLEAIAKTLPPDIRGKIVGSFPKVADLKTTKGRENHMVNLLPKIEQAVESYLQKQFRQAIRRTMDKSRPQKNDSRNIRGKIGGLGHAVAKQAVAAMTMEHETAMKQAAAIREEIDTKAGDLTFEEFEEMEAKAMALELFADYKNADSARLEKALEFINANYSAGREEWISTLKERKAKREGEIETLKRVLNAPDFITEAMLSEAAAADKKPGEVIGDALLEWISSAYQTLDRLKERTSDPAAIAWVDSQQERLRKARGEYDDAVEAERLALNKAMRGIFGIKEGWRGEFDLDPILYELSKAGDSPVSIIEGFKKSTITVPISNVEALVNREVAGFERSNGQMETLDDADLQALGEAWEEFQDLPEEAQKNQRVIRFERIDSKGKRGSIGQISQLEGLKEWLAMRQPDAATKYDKIGWDARTFQELDRWLKPEVKALGLWMVDRLAEQAPSLDAMHRSEFGIGLDLVENYFPLLFNAGADKEANVSPDGADVAVRAKTASSLKARVSHRARPRRMNAVSVFLSNRAQIHYFMTHAETLREMVGIFRSREANESISATLGPNYLNALTKELKLIETNGVMQADGVLVADRFIRKVQSGYALGILGLKLKTLLVNTTAVWNTLLGVPVTKLAKGLTPEYVNDLRAVFDSPAMQRRMNYGTSHEMRLAMQGGVGGHPLAAGSRRVAQAPMEFINVVDSFSNTLTMALAYRAILEEARAAGLSDELAKLQAENEIDRLSATVAQPNNLLSRSMGEVKLSQSPIGGLLFMFASETRKNLAIGIYAARKLTTGKGAVSNEMAAQQLIVLGLFYSASGYLLRTLYQSLFQADDDEPEEILKRWGNRLTDAKAWANAMATEHLKGIPLIGEAMNHAVAGTVNAADFIPGEKIKTMDTSPNPLNKFGAGIGKAVDALNNEKTTEDRIQATIDAIQGTMVLTPETAVLAQAGNVGEDLLGLLNANGMAISDDGRAKRIKARLAKFSKDLESIHGKTTGPDGKILKDVQTKKQAALADKLRAELAPLEPATRAKILDAIDPSEAVRKLAGFPSKE